jgi:hypothetical protein
MESMMSASESTQLCQHLHEINLRLCFWLDSLSSEPAATCDPPVATPQQIAGLLSELMRAGEWLRRLPERNREELQDEMDAYRRSIERLRDLLPAIHAGLLHERARLEQKRARIASAAEWVRRSRDTL